MLTSLFSLFHMYVTGEFHRFLHRRDKVTDKRYLYPIGDSRSSLNYRKKGQLAELVRESDLFFRVKRQIKTVLTNVVVEHGKTTRQRSVRGS